MLRNENKVGAIFYFIYLFFFFLHYMVFSDKFVNCYGDVGINLIIFVHCHKEHSKIKL